MKRKRAERIIAEAMLRGRAAKMQSPPVDVRRTVAKIGPAINEALAPVADAYAARMEALYRTVAKIEGAQATTPMQYGYVDRTTGAYVPLRLEEVQPLARDTREVGKADVLAAAALVLPDGSPLRQELSRAAAFRELQAERPWAGGNGRGPGGRAR